LIAAKQVFDIIQDRIGVTVISPVLPLLPGFFAFLDEIIGPIVVRISIDLFLAND
jgi:hypothetical protein